MILWEFYKSKIMKVLLNQTFSWPLSNMTKTVKVVDDDGKIQVYIDGVDKTDVKEEIFKTINWYPIC